MTYHVYFIWNDDNFEDVVQCTSRSELEATLQYAKTHNQTILRIANKDYEPFSKSFYDNLNKKFNINISK